MRNHLKILLMIVLLPLLSCRQERTNSYVGIPEDSILSRETMISMLTDVHLAEASLQLERAKGADAFKLTPRYYQLIFSKYKVSERRFTASLEYYKQDQGYFIKMYDEVIDSLETRAERMKVAPDGEKE